MATTIVSTGAESRPSLPLGPGREGRRAPWPNQCATTPWPTCTPRSARSIDAALLRIEALMDGIKSLDPGSNVALLAELATEQASIAAVALAEQRESAA